MEIILSIVAGVKDRIRRFAKARYPKPHLENMAAAAGINYRQLSGYSDNNLPSGPNALKLRTIGLSIDWLLTGEGSMVVPPAGVGDFEISDIRTAGMVLEKLHEYIKREQTTSPDDRENGTE